MMRRIRPAGSVRAELLVALVASLLVAIAAGDAPAAPGPFGVGAAPAPALHGPEVAGWLGWLFAKQAEFYRGLAAMIRAAKSDGSAVYGLLGLSLAYGIFHAAGPGHGKAVISSYLVANDETWRRGVALSFASALMQALVAIAIVGVAAALVGATAKMMGDTTRLIEQASYLLIIAVGARLSWTKGRGFLSAWRETFGPAPAPGHVHDDHGGHSHGPEPDSLAGPGGWRRGLSAIVAVGLRPCSGAILVLVFALAQGLFWAGVAATLVMGLGTAITVAVIATLAVAARGLAMRLARTRDGYGELALRGLEAGAGALVLCFGVLLLTGYMASERLFAV